MNTLSEFMRRYVGLLVIVLLCACEGVLSFQSDRTVPEDALSVTDSAGSLGDAATDAVVIDAPSSGDSSQPDATYLSEAFTLRDVVAFQTNRVPIVSNGSWVTSRPMDLIARRETYFRIYVDPTGSTGAGEQVTAVLTITTGSVTERFSDTRTLSGASDDAVAGSYFEIDTLQGAITSDSKMRIEITADTGTTVVDATNDHPARFPQNGSSQPLLAEENGGMDVVIVRVEYQGDGSSRLPPMDSATEQAYFEHARALFPADELRLSVYPTVMEYSSPITRIDGLSWSAFLNAALSFRATEAPDRAGYSPYFLFLVNPAPDFSSYCDRFCIAGLASLNTVNAASLRVGTAVGYPTERNRFSGLHELAHAAGRAHSPDGTAQQTDPNYPVVGGFLGVDGFDRRSKRVFEHAATFDYMTYSRPQWTSAYTSQAMHERMQAISQQSFFRGELHEYHLAVVHAGADGTFNPAAVVKEYPLGESLQVEAFGSAGSSLGVVEGFYVPVTHIDAASYYLPRVGGAVRYVLPSGQQVRARP